MKPKIQVNFDRYADADLSTKAEYIVSCMTASTQAFPEPVPELTEIKTALAKYNNGLVAASGNDKVLVVEKNKSRKILSELLNRLGLHVMCVAKGDIGLLAQSGFSLAKAPESRYISNPGNVTLKNGKSSGEMEASVKPVKHAAIYRHEITGDFPNAEAHWTSVTSSRRRHLFSDLVPGKKYWVRVSAMLGSQVACSPVSSMFVQ